MLPCQSRKGLARGLRLQGVILLFAHTSSSARPIEVAAVNVLLDSSCGGRGLLPLFDAFRAIFGNRFTFGLPARAPPPHMLLFVIKMVRGSVNVAVHARRGPCLAQTCQVLGLHAHVVSVIHLMMLLITACIDDFNVQNAAFARSTVAFRLLIVVLKVSFLVDVERLGDVWVDGQVLHGKRLRMIVCIDVLHGVGG